MANDGFLRLPIDGGKMMLNGKWVSVSVRRYKHHIAKLSDGLGLLTLDPKPSREL